MQCPLKTKDSEGETDFLQLGDFKYKTWTSRNLLSLAKASAYCCWSSGFFSSIFNGRGIVKLGQQGCRIKSCTKSLLPVAPKNGTETKKQWSTWRAGTPFPPTMPFEGLSCKQYRQSPLPHVNLIYQTTKFYRLNWQNMHMNQLTMKKNTTMTCKSNNRLPKEKIVTFKNHVAKIEPPCHAKD